MKGFLDLVRSHMKTALPNIRNKQLLVSLENFNKANLSFKQKRLEPTNVLPPGPSV